MTVLILEAHHIERGQGKVSKGIGTWQRGRPDAASSPAPAPPRVTRSCGRASDSVPGFCGGPVTQAVCLAQTQIPDSQRKQVSGANCWQGLGAKSHSYYLMVVGTLPSPGPRCQLRASLSAASQACSELFTAAITSKVTQVVMGPVQTQAAGLQNCTVSSETRSVLSKWWVCGLM